MHLLWDRLVILSEIQASVCHRNSIKSIIPAYLNAYIYR